jgi:tetratricopeptide (TPR) repeat protein
VIPAREARSTVGPAASVLVPRCPTVGQRVATAWRMWSRFSTPYDLFVSYRWSDRPWVEALVTALQGQGVECWFDRRYVEPFGGITSAVQKGIAASRALLACYSADYPRSRICQWELTLAYLAGEAASPQERRVLVVNPEPDTAHLHLGPLADQLAVTASRSMDPDDHQALAVAVAVALASRRPIMGQLRPAPRPPWLGARVPLGSDRFVGRGRELWELHGLLRRGLDDVVHAASAGRQTVACLVGMGGVGKSQLAEEYAIRFGAAYPGGIAWLDGLAFSDEHDRRDDDTEALSRQLRAVAQGLAVATDDDASVDELRGRIASRLTTSGRILWVVDDLAGGLSRGRLDRWLAPVPGAATIVTTRTTAYREAVPSLDVEALDEPDGVALLASRPALAEAFDPDAAARIVAALGGHALAVDVTGALLSRTTAPSMAAFAAELEDPSRASIAALGEDLGAALPSGHESSILLTILRSIEQLDDDGVTVLTLAGVLAPRPLQIPVDLLSVAAGYLADGENGDEPARRVDAGCELAVSMSLLRSSGPGSRAVDIHPVVAGVISQLQVHVNAAARVAVLTALDELLALSATAHVVSQARYLTEGAPATELEAIVSGWVAEHDLEAGAYAAARDRATAAVGVLEDARDPDTTPWQVHRIRSCLAASMLKLGDVTGARQLYQWELDRAFFDAEDPNTLVLQQGLAGTYSADGDHGRAADLLRTVADGAADAVGPEHDLTLSAKNSLGMELQALGKLDESRQVLEEVLQTRARVLGWTDRHTMNTRTNLASTLSNLGERDRARTLLEGVLDDRRRYLGEDHPDTVQIINNLAVVTEDPDEAERLYREAIASYTRMFGANHFETLNSTSGLAALLARVLRFDEAAALLEEVVQGRMASLGTEHPKTARAQHDLALVEHLRAVVHRGENDRALSNLVVKWLLAPPWAETLQFIAAHPQLADGRAEALLAGLLADNPNDQWLADRVELLGEVAEAGLDTLADLAHPQRWRAVYDREVDRADVSGLHRMITWRAWLLGRNGREEICHLYVLLLLQNRAADAWRLAGAIAADGPEAVASTKQVLDRLSRTRPDLASAGQSVLGIAGGG